MAIGVEFWPNRMIIVGFCLNWYSFSQGQKLLDEILEKTLVFVKQDIPVIKDEPQKEEGGIRLFKYSSPGIVFDRVGECI